MPTEDALAIRLEYQACLKLADETDSKQADQYLRSEASRLLKALKAACNHDVTVVTQSAYPAWSSYDESTPEYRRCLCCGVTEDSYDEFSLLTHEPFIRFENNLPDEIKKPLYYLLSESVEVAKSKGHPYFGKRR